MLLAEPEQSLVSGALVHRTVDVFGAETRVGAKLVQVLDVILGGTEDNSLLALGDAFSQDVEQTSFLFGRSDHKEMELQLVRQLGVSVNLHHAVVLHTREGELFNFT